MTIYQKIGLNGARSPSKPYSTEDTYFTRIPVELVDHWDIFKELFDLTSTCNLVLQRLIAFQTSGKVETTVKISAKATSDYMGISRDSFSNALNLLVKAELIKEIHSFDRYKRTYSLKGFYDFCKLLGELRDKYSKQVAKSLDHGEMQYGVLKI